MCLWVMGTSWWLVSSLCSVPLTGRSEVLCSGVQTPPLPHHLGVLRKVICLGTWRSFQHRRKPRLANSLVGMRPGDGGTDGAASGQALLWVLESVSLLDLLTHTSPKAKGRTQTQDPGGTLAVSLSPCSLTG